MAAVAADANDASSGKTASFLRDKHAEYLLSLFKEQDTYEHFMTEHIRVSGIYWGVAAMRMIRLMLLLSWSQVVDDLLESQCANGGWGGYRGHDPYLLHTTSAVQVLAMCGALSRIDSEKVVAYVAGLQQEDGSFFGDEWGEIDTRFSYCALLTPRHPRKAGRHRC